MYTELYVLGTIVGIFHALTHLVQTTPLRVSYLRYYSDFKGNLSAERLSNLPKAFNI